MTDTSWLRQVAIALGLTFLCLGQAIAQDELVFGSVAMDIPAEMHKRLKPLTGYLSREMGMPVRLQLSPNMADAIDKVASGKVDLAYLTPVAYLDSHAKGDTRLLVKTVTKGHDSFQLMIVARADGPIKAVADLHDRSFAFGDPKALLQRAVVVGSGITLDQLGETAFIGHYDNIARGVMAGDFDAGIVKDTKAYEWERKGLKIIYASAPLPPYNIAVRHELAPELAERLKQAFLKLNVHNPAHLPVIKALNSNYDGFAATTDSEYDVVRRLVKPFR
jgi:phosphonate transport system substrate-binding protein